MENIAVITTRFVLENHSPILSVFKDEEGGWQFFGVENNILEEDARVLSLDEMVQMDSTIKNILEIDNGTHAWRENIHQKWKIEKYNQEE